MDMPLPDMPTLPSSEGYDAPPPPPLPEDITLAGLAKEVHAVQLSVHAASARRVWLYETLNQTFRSIQVHLREGEQQRQEQFESMSRSLMALTHKIEALEHGISGHLGSQGVSDQLRSTKDDLIKMAASTQSLTILLSSIEARISVLEASCAASTTRNKEAQEHEAAAKLALATMRRDIDDMRSTCETTVLKAKAKGPADKILDKVRDALIPILVMAALYLLIQGLIGSGAVKSPVPVPAPVHATPHTSQEP